jgi:hypothetical protein
MTSRKRKGIAPFALPRLWGICSRGNVICYHAENYKKFCQPYRMMIQNNNKILNTVMCMSTAQLPSNL